MCYAFFITIEKSKNKVRKVRTQNERKRTEWVRKEKIHGGMGHVGKSFTDFCSDKPSRCLLVYSKTFIEWLLNAKYQVGKDPVKLKKGIKTNNLPTKYSSGHEQYSLVHKGKII